MEEQEYCSQGAQIPSDCVIVKSVGITLLNYNSSPVQILDSKQQSMKPVC